MPEQMADRACTADKELMKNRAFHSGG